MLLIFMMRVANTLANFRSTNVRKSSKCQLLHTMNKLYFSVKAFSVADSAFASSNRSVETVALTFISHNRSLELQLGQEAISKLAYCAAQGDAQN